MKKKNNNQIPLAEEQEKNFFKRLLKRKKIKSKDMNFFWFLKYILTGAFLIISFLMIFATIALAIGKRAGMAVGGIVFLLLIIITVTTMILVKKKGGKNDE